MRTKLWGFSKGKLLIIRAVGTIEASPGRAGVGGSSVSPKTIILKPLRYRHQDAEPTIPTHDSRLRNERKVRRGSDPRDGRVIPGRGPRVTAAACRSFYRAILSELKIN
jgi:hypothetical protein